VLLLKEKKAVGRTDGERGCEDGERGCCSEGRVLLPPQRSRMTAHNNSAVEAVTVEQQEESREKLL
jgi:hypothetical protein